MWILDHESQVHDLKSTLYLARYMIRLYIRLRDEYTCKFITHSHHFFSTHGTHIQLTSYALFSATI